MNHPSGKQIPQPQSSLQLTVALTDTKTKQVLPAQNTKTPAPKFLIHRNCEIISDYSYFKLLNFGITYYTV